LQIIAGNISKAGWSCGYVSAGATEGASLCAQMES
jgi:hypothetical protein